MWLRPKLFSGVCLCGCVFDDHHLGVVLNAEYHAATGEDSVAQECERYGFNERGGLGPEGEPHCDGYVDKDDPFGDRHQRWHARLVEWVKERET